MMHTRILLRLVVLVMASLNGAVGFTCIQAAEPETPAAKRPDKFDSIYTVAEFDASRDPSQDLAATITRAQRHRKRIIVEVGGSWCGWCRALDQFIHRNDAIAKELHNNFFIMKVNDSLEKPILKFLAKYPSVYETPHLFVLETDGTLLHSQNPAEFEAGGAYNVSKFLRFLRHWEPKAKPDRGDDDSAEEALR